PLGSEDNFRGMVDLVEMKAYVWFSDEKDAQWEGGDVTPDLAARLGLIVKEDLEILASIAQARVDLVDSALEMDHDAMEAYLETDEEPAPDVLRACLRTAQ